MIKFLVICVNNWCKFNGKLVEKVILIIVFAVWCKVKGFVEFVGNIFKLKIFIKVLSLFVRFIIWLLIVLGKIFFVFLGK